MKTLDIRLRLASTLATSDSAVMTSPNVIFSDSFVLFFQCHMMFLAVRKDMSVMLWNVSHNLGNCYVNSCVSLQS